MKLPRSFSLLSFLLLTAIFALAVADFSLRSELAKAKLLNQNLIAKSGHITVTDTSLLHARVLRHDVPMTFRFQVFVPKGKSYILNIGEGVLDKESKYPPVIVGSEIVGTGHQGNLILNLRRHSNPNGFLKAGWAIRVCGDIIEVTDTIVTDIDRFQWLDELETTVAIDQYHSQVDSFDGLTTVVLFNLIESEAVRYAFEPNKRPSDPRVFRIWLEPIGVKEEQK